MDTTGPDLLSFSGSARDGVDNGAATVGAGVAVFGGCPVGEKLGGGFPEIFEELGTILESVDNHQV